MSKVIGICNLHNDPHLGEITKNRPLAALTFLGRYGIIDFTLSNFSNSAILLASVILSKAPLKTKRPNSSKLLPIADEGTAQGLFGSNLSPMPSRAYLIEVTLE